MTGENDTSELHVKVVQKLLRNRVTGAKHHQPQTIAGWFATDEQGRVKEIIDEMTSDREAPLREKGRGTVQLVSIEKGKEYVEEHGGDLPWGLRD